MKRFLSAGVICCAMVVTIFIPARPVLAQQVDAGIGQGYAGEWSHMSKQLLELAEAFPADKYGWRPAPGVRSTSEVFMHIAVANLYYLSVIGKPMPPEIKDRNFEKQITAKLEVISWLKRSLEAVKSAHEAETPADLQRKVKFFTVDTTVDAAYLRAIVHSNEHMGQLVAYARMNGIVPPWSKTDTK